MENNRNYRIRTSTDDKVVPVNLSQDIDFLEVLSMKLRMKDAYRLNSSSYGILMGRVLANDAFGIPNAKVSVFIEKADETPDVSEIYPYATVSSRGKDGVRYNLLHEECGDECHADVGTFPNKRRVLDNDTVLYVYDKYYKYVTSTNEAGDYMLYGVPVGVQIVHTDVDLSDIGVLSQKPRDMVYEGYDINEFENPCQFKKSKELNYLPQIISQEQSVSIYPFFGDSTQNEIAISRCDVHISYKFEPTCVFMGSVVTDNEKNSLSNRCRPSRKAGYNRNIVASHGTIEMIRKTPGGYVEEHNINGAQLIDGDGVWCYQIPMNLDYVGTDEYGNIVPTDDPSKGIPTRSRVRFRISIDENGEEGKSRHRAKMLVPSVGGNQESVYEFGSATDDEYFRDLYWNKIYSVKSYIPRLQKYRGARYDRFCGLKKTNDDGDFNPIPYNTVRTRNPFVYAFLCSLAQILDIIVTSINVAINSINVAFASTAIFAWLMIPCVKMGSLGGDGKVYAPGCGPRGRKRLAKEEKTSESNIVTDARDVADALQGELAEDFDVVNMDFSNDWLNGCMYMPMFYYKGRRNWNILGVPFSHTSKKRFCSCDNKNRMLKLYESCSLGYKGGKDGISVVPNKASDRKTDDGRSGEANDSSYVEMGHGVIKEFINADGLPIYYYQTGFDKNGVHFHLYSNDIILLGSVNDCDIDGIPQLVKYIPSTTSNVPEFYADRDDDEGGDGDYDVTGMDWGNVGDKDGFRGGYFTNIKCSNVHTSMKTCINAERLCELGVGLETRGEDSVSTGDGTYEDIRINTRGTVTEKDIFGEDARSIFATLNSRPLIGSVTDKSTGYKKYDFKYVYTNGFDGSMRSAYKRMKQSRWTETPDPSYIEYRFGGSPKYGMKDGGANKFPIYANSFYFYFGIKPGNTAIDKMRKLYFAECKKDIPGTFEYEVEYETDKECDDKGGWIKLNLSGVKRPCSINVYRNDELERSVDEYDNGIFLMEGVRNGSYTIVIEDTNGIVKTKEVDLRNEPIRAIAEKRDLGFDYTKHPSEEYAKEYGRYGVVDITGASIYGDDETFTRVTSADTAFICETSGGHSVMVEVEGLDGITISTGDTISMYCEVYEPTSGITITTSLLCDGEAVSGYTTTETIEVMNGNDFVAFMNSMPTEYMGKYTKWYADPENPEKWDFPENYDDESWGNYIETDDGEIKPIDVEKAKFDAIASICHGIYCTGVDESMVMTAFGGDDVVYSYCGPNVDNPDESGKVKTFFEYDGNSAYMNPDIPLQKSDLTPNPEINGGEDDHLYYFACATNNAVGEHQTIPQGVDYMAVEESEVTSIKPGIKQKYIGMPYIDRRITLGRNTEGESYIVSPNPLGGEGVVKIGVNGGIELSYDEEMNVIGEGLEWSMVDGKLTKNPNPNRKLYKVMLGTKDVTDGNYHDIGEELGGDKPDALVVSVTGCSYGIESVIDSGNTITATTEGGAEEMFELPYGETSMMFVKNKFEDAEIGEVENVCNAVYRRNAITEKRIRIYPSNGKHGNASTVWKPFIVPEGDLSKTFGRNTPSWENIDVASLWRKEGGEVFDHTFFNHTSNKLTAWFKLFDKESDKDNLKGVIEYGDGENVTIGDELDLSEVELYASGDIGDYGLVCCKKLYDFGGDVIAFTDRNMVYDFREIGYESDGWTDVVIDPKNNKAFAETERLVLVLMDNSYIEFEKDETTPNKFNNPSVATAAVGIYIENKQGFTAYIKIE